MTYTRATAVSRIQRGLGFRTDLTDEIVSALQEAQRILERGRSLPYFLLSEDQTLAVTSGSTDISLPTGFLREKQDEPLRFTDSDNNLIKLEKIALDVGVETFADVDAGKPQAYTIRKTAIKFYPSRDTSYSLTWSYYVVADALESDITNAWLTYAPEVLVGAAGMIIAADLGANGEKAMAKFKSLYDVAWAGMFADGIVREQENLPLAVGGRL